TASANDAEEDVVGIRPLKRNLESKLVAIKCERRRYVGHDKKGRDAGNLCLCHMDLQAFASNILFGGVMRTVPFLPVRLLVEPELVADRIRKRGKRTHARPNVR